MVKLTLDEIKFWDTVFTSFIGKPNASAYWAAKAADDAVIERRKRWDRSSDNNSKGAYRDIQFTADAMKGTNFVVPFFVSRVSEQNLRDTLGAYIISPWCPQAAPIKE